MLQQQTLTLLLPSYVVYSIPVSLRMDENVTSRAGRFLESFLLRQNSLNSVMALSFGVPPQDFQWSHLAIPVKYFGGTIALEKELQGLD